MLRPSPYDRTADRSFGPRDRKHAQELIFNITPEYMKKCGITHIHSREGMAIGSDGVIRYDFIVSDNRGVVNITVPLKHLTLLDPVVKHNIQTIHIIPAKGDISAWVTFDGRWVLNVSLKPDGVLKEAIDAFLATETGGGFIIDLDADVIDTKRRTYGELK